MIRSNRKGFTLVELLIVIVVIGVLSAMMMLSSTEAVSSARASTIISDLRNLKTAVLAVFVDSPDLQTTHKLDASTYPAIRAAVAKYMGGDDLLVSTTGAHGGGEGDGKYSIQRANNNDNYWYVAYKLPNANDKTLKSKLASRAKALGLLQNRTNKPITEEDYYTGNKAVSGGTTGAFVMMQVAVFE